MYNNYSLRMSEINEQYYLGQEGGIRNTALRYLYHLWNGGVLSEKGLDLVVNIYCKLKGKHQDSLKSINDMLREEEKMQP